MFSGYSRPRDRLPIMTHLHEHRFLKCPYTRAKGYLHEALQSLASTQGQQRLTLQVPFSDARGLRKDVLVTYGTGADPMHFDEPWHIHWVPAGGGPYPEFDGELTIRADQDYPTSIIELTGAYKPPLGVAGALFDAVAGSKIASVTAQKLLAELGDEMERRYRSEESLKQRERAPG